MDKWDYATFALRLLITGWILRNFNVSQWWKREKERAASYDVVNENTRERKDLPASLSRSLFIHKRGKENNSHSLFMTSWMKNETSSIFRCLLFLFAYEWEENSRCGASFTKPLRNNFPCWISEKFFIFIAHDTESPFVFYDVVCEKFSPSGVFIVLVRRETSMTPTRNRRADCIVISLWTVSNNYEERGWLSTSTFFSLLRSYDVIENWLKFFSWNFHSSELEIRGSRHTTADLFIEFNSILWR